jgi:hypothetical protein
MSPADQRRIRAENLVRRPGLIGATGNKRDAVLELRAEAEAALADADDRLRAAADDRLAAANRIRACNRALVGTGQVIDRRTGASTQYLVRRSDSFEDPLPDPAELEVVAGEELRDIVVGLLQTLSRPVTVAELVRLVAAHGFRPSGRPSQSISNALRVEMRWSTVKRVARGTYTAT